MNKPGLAHLVSLKVHKDQTRWDGRPYSVHPEKVVKIIKAFGVEDEDILSAGYLHDTLEDTNITEDDISSQFGFRVLGLVKELTFQDSKNNDQLYYDQVKCLSPDARIIKVADIIANLTDDGRKSDHFIRKRVEALRIMFADTVTGTSTENEK